MTSLSTRTLLMGRSVTPTVCCTYSTPDAFKSTAHEYLSFWCRLEDGELYLGAQYADGIAIESTAEMVAA